ncbi:MAG: SPFH domain-containing protein [Candidatus Paceibacterota bacterium]
MQQMIAEINLGQAIVPGFIVVLFVGILFVVWAMTKRYKRIPPNAIGVIYGRKRIQTANDGTKSEVGFRLVTGGGVFVMPIVEAYAEMSTESFKIGISEEDIPTKKNVRVRVNGVAVCRISATAEEQTTAVQLFLNNEQEMRDQIQSILRGHLRSIIGGLEVEELLRERAKFNEMVVHECSTELSRMGIKILTLVIQDIEDKEGYIEALGRQAVAGTKRDANIAVAEAERETAIKTSNASRDAAQAVAANDAMVKEAEKNRDIQVAQFTKETQAKKAEADASFAIANADQQRLVKLQEATRDTAAAEAQAKVQEMEARRRQKELEATVIVEAEVHARALKIAAEGKRQAEQVEADTRNQVATIDAQRAAVVAEGLKNAAIKTGEGEAQKRLVTAEAEAEATRKTMVAKAEGDKAILLAAAEGAKASKLAEAEGEGAKLNAQAEGRKRFLLAEAEGQERSLLATAHGKQKYLLAEAEGTEKLAQALQQLSEQGKLILILDRLPLLLDKAGTAGAQIAKEVFGPIGNAIGAIDSVKIVDLGGGNTAKTGIANLGNMVPGLVTDFIVGLQARGIDPTALLSFLKLNPDGLLKMIETSALAAVPAKPVQAEAGAEPPKK